MAGMVKVLCEMNSMRCVYGCPRFSSYRLFSPHNTHFFLTCTFGIMFVVVFRLFLLCDNSHFFFLSLRSFAAPFTSSFLFQFCFIFIMGSTKGNAIAILFVASMVSFGFLIWRVRILL